MGTRICVLFLHGLTPFGTLAEASSRQFLSNLHFHLSSLLDTDQDVQLEDCDFINYVGFLQEEQSRLWRGNVRWEWDVTLPFRIVPLKILNLGLSYWGNPKFRNRILTEISQRMAQMYEHQKVLHPDSSVKFVLVGFSMGATIFFDFLSNCKESTRYDVTFVTLGCAINWHFPIRPIESNLLESSKAVPWCNIYYSSDVLAYPLREQWSGNSTIKDEEISAGVEWLNYLSFYAIFSLLTRLLLHPIQSLHFLISFICRLTPLSHFYYHSDILVFRKIAAFVSASFSADVDVSELKPLTPKRFSEPVSFSLMCKYGRGQHMNRTHTAIVYLPGMSRPQEAAKEALYFESNLLKHISNSKSIGSPYSFSVYSTEYSSLCHQDQKIRIGSKLLGKRFHSVYDTLRKIVLERCTIAMAIWTSTRMRDALVSSFQRELFRMIEEEKSHCEKLNVVFVGYTVGGILSLNALGHISNLYGEEKNFLSVVGVEFKLLVTLACPIAWFGYCGDMFPLPKSCHWINIFLANDLFKVSLKATDKTTYRCQEVRILKSMVFGRRQFLSEFLASTNGLLLRDDRLYSDILGPILNQID